MKKNAIAVLVSALCISFALSSIAAPPAKTDTSVAQGQKLALKFCQACHQYQGTEQAGTVAPPLMGMKARFPDKKKLYNIIYDPQVALKRHTMMPPFGRNELLAKEEIEKVIEFLYTL